MIRRPVSVFAVILLIAVLTGCQKKTESSMENTVQNETLPVGESFTEPSEVRAPSANGGTAVSDMAVPEKISVDTSEEGQTEKNPSEMPEEIPKEPTEQKNVQDQRPEQEEQTAGISGNKIRFGAFRKVFSALDTPPKDTIGYMESKKEEITRTQYVESVIDENDPDTYEIVEKEQEVPAMYVNQAGDIKYAYEDGVWYEYKYSSGNVTLGVRDEALALRLLNLRGTYDGFEVMSIDCTEAEDENHEVQYQYRVRYQQICAMDGSPSEMSNLAAVDLGIVAATMLMTTEEMVPVMTEETVGTGEYHYYGWQELEDGTFYFDGNGEKVTGLQVIQGIRHVFDEDGVKISRSGVEVSEENKEIDWEQVAEAKIDLAMIQCAYRESEDGTLLPDSQAERNLSGARQAGLETGISLRSQAITEEEALEEAELLISMADRYQITGPVAVTVSYANPEHNGRADGIGKEERTKYIAACCQRLQEAGYMPVLHVDEAFLSDGLNMEELSACRIWLTAYGSELTYTGSCEIWQYTDKGTVNGINGYTGLNISCGK